MPRTYNDLNRSQKMSETRQRLIEAAIEEMARVGYENASIARITQSAGVATGTIYNYFPGKLELMLALLAEIGTRHCAYISEQVRQEPDCTLRIQRLLTICFEYIMARPHQSRVLFASMQGSNARFREYLSQIYQPMLMLIHDEILIPGMERGDFQPLEPMSTSIMIMTFYLGVGSTVGEDGTTPLDLNAVADFVLRALGAKTGSAA